MNRMRTLSVCSLRERHVRMAQLLEENSGAIAEPVPIILQKQNSAQHAACNHLNMCAFFFFSSLFLTPPIWERSRSGELLKYHDSYKSTIFFQCVYPRFGSQSRLQVKAITTLPD